MKKTILILLVILTLAFTFKDNRNIYNIPVYCANVCVVDFNHDNKLDIITGHYYNSMNDFGGLYMLQNKTDNTFSFYDSISTGTGGKTVYVDTIFNNEYPEIIYDYYDSINIISDSCGFLKSYCYPTGENFDDFDIGDINNDGMLDIVFEFRGDKYWGIIYNLGDKQFSDPEYFYVDEAIFDITCADLNNDNRCDIILSGQDTKLIYNKFEGFETSVLETISCIAKAADIDNDNDMDFVSIATIPGISIMYFHENKGDEIFDTINTFELANGCSDFLFEDFNRDGLQDILFSPSIGQRKLMIFYNEGNFIFSEPEEVVIEYNGEASKYVTIGDMDGNLYSDIVIARMSANTVYVPANVEILFNDGNGNFVDYPLNTDENILSENNIGFINYPNPFTISTTFEFDIYESSQVELSVYDLSGRLIDNILNEKLNTGTHKVKWDGQNNASQACKPGPYIAYLRVNGQVLQSIKLIID